MSYVGFSPADLRVTDADISAALGPVSDIRDVERFLDFAERSCCDQEPDGHGRPPRLRCSPAGARTRSPYFLVAERYDQRIHFGAQPQDH